MHYIGASIHSVLGPKNLGTYELELVPLIHKASSKNYRLIVDVGAAEGYYAVGLALRNPLSQVVAFEADPEGRRLLAVMVGENAVKDHVEIRGYCAPADLESILATADRTLVVMDVEGTEQTLLDPSVCPSLSRSEIVVELHEFICSGIGGLLHGRFAVTHDIQEIWEEERPVNNLPFVIRLLARLCPTSLFLNVMKEHRPVRMSWLHLVPKSAV
jgi:hypothetical protein